MFRFSLASLLLIVLLAAVGSAAIANPTDLWRQTVVTFTVGTLLAATLMAFFGRSSMRTFAGGYAIAGWLYFSLTFTGVFNLRQDLLTGRVIESLQVVILQEPRTSKPVRSWADGRWTVGPPRDSTIRIWDLGAPPPSDKVRCFHDIGHSLWTIIVGCIGGMAASWLGRSMAKQSSGGG